MTRQEHIKRARYKSPSKWTSTETDAYHARMQALLEERAEARRAKQREILRDLKEEEESE
jgi:hypothetical protein